MTFPFYSIYNSTKWAVEGFSECLQYELRKFNIRVKIIEPGIIKTDFYGRSKDKMKKKDITEYDDIVDKMSDYEEKNMKEGKYSDPSVVAKTIFKAANDNSWKLRYKTGKYASLILSLRKILPDSIFLRLIRYITLK